MGLSTRPAKGQVAAARRKAGPHRHAGPAGHRAAAAVLWRGDQVQPAAWMPTRATATTLRLGVRTSTATGRGVGRASARLTASAGGRAAGPRLPADRQLPPMQRAEKDGKALYEYAPRRDRDRARRAPGHDPRARAVGLDLGRCANLAAPARARAARAPTSARSAEDIGEALGCGAHLSERRRRAAAGPFASA